MIAYRIVCYLSLAAITYFGNFNPWVFISVVPLLVAYVLDSYKVKVVEATSEAKDKRIKELEGRIQSLENRFNMRAGR